MPQRIIATASACSQSEWGRNLRDFFRLKFKTYTDRGDGELELCNLHTNPFDFEALNKCEQSFALQCRENARILREKAEASERTNGKKRTNKSLCKCEKNIGKICAASAIIIHAMERSRARERKKQFVFDP